MIPTYPGYYKNYDVEENEKEFQDEPQLNQKLCFKQQQTEKEALELTYSHLGRLVQSAEMLAYKLNLIKKDSVLKYQIYDAFEIADKKSVDTLRYDVINFLDFYEKAIQIHNKKFNYVNPASIGELIKDLINWQNRAPKNDKRFFSTILDLIRNGTYDDSVFPDQNILYEKAMKDNAKFKKNAGFWKTFSVPILKFLNSLIKGVQEKVKQNPDYMPDIQFGQKPKNNSYLKKSVEFKQKEIEINSKINEINTILYSISLKKCDPNSLVVPVEKLNNLISEFKKKFGEEVEFDQNSISLLKNLILSIKLDRKISKMLNDICIEIDSESLQ